MDKRREPTRQTLTEKTIASAKPRETNYEIRDRGGKASVPGLLLRVSPKGMKTWIFQVKRGVRVVLGHASDGAGMIRPTDLTLAQARVMAKSKAGEAADGVDLQADQKNKKLTLGKFIDGAWTDYGETHIASFPNMKATVKRSFAELLNKPMTEISELDMARWKKGRNERTNQDGTKRQDVKLETIKRELTYLRAVLNHAVKVKEIPSHQLTRYKAAGTLTDAASETKVRYLTHDEEKALRAELDAREDRIRKERASANNWRRARRQELMPEIGVDEFADHIKPLVLLALNTGLRRGDLFGLQWDHVDLEHRQIRKVIGKSSHARRKAARPAKVDTLPLSKEAHAILLQLKRQRDPESDLVFPSPVSGTRLDNINKAFAKVLEDAKITGFRFHDLRHTFASRLVMAGVDINTVRELMTHSDIKMTLVYAHLSPDHKAAALEKAFGGAA